MHYSSALGNLFIVNRLPKAELFNYIVCKASVVASDTAPLIVSNPHTQQKILSRTQIY